MKQGPTRYHVSFLPHTFQRCIKTSFFIYKPTTNEMKTVRKFFILYFCVPNKTIFCCVFLSPRRGAPKTNFSKCSILIIFLGELLNGTVKGGERWRVFIFSYRHFSRWREEWKLHELCMIIALNHSFIRLLARWGIEDVLFGFKKSRHR